MKSHLVVYSINTSLAFMINETYYDHKHYVWCSPYFDCKKKDSVLRNNPVSSNPYDIYIRFKTDIESKDKHSSIIEQNRVGLINGVNVKKSQGIIDDIQAQEIIGIITDASMEDFRPLIYVIPVHNVASIGKLAPARKRAHPFSKEFIIEELLSQHFDIIEFDGRL